MLHDLITHKENESNNQEKLQSFTIDFYDQNIRTKKYFILKRVIKANLNFIESQTFSEVGPRKVSTSQYAPSIQIWVAAFLLGGN